MNGADVNTPFVLAVASGKGGVGKTQMSMNIAYALSQYKQKVLLVDADFGLCNIDVLWGIKSVNNLSHVLSGQCSVESVIKQAPGGVRFIPAATASTQLANMNNLAVSGLLKQISDIDENFDFVIFDCAAGINHLVSSVAHTAHATIVVVNDEPSSLTDAYALIKVLSDNNEAMSFKVICNRVSHQQQGQELFNRLQKTCDKFCPVNLQLLGSIPEDSFLKQSVQQCSSVSETYPSSRSSKALRHFSSELIRVKNSLLNDHNLSRYEPVLPYFQQSKSFNGVNNMSHC